MLVLVCIPSFVILKFPIVPSNALISAEELKTKSETNLPSKGIVVDSGNHEQLLEKSQTYKNFYDKQISKN